MVAGPPKAQSTIKRPTVHLKHQYLMEAGKAWLAGKTVYEG